MTRHRPEQVLGYSRSSWKIEDLRVILSHYGMMVPRNTSKFKLMQRLEIVANERGLTARDRRAIMDAHRSGSPLPAVRPVIDDVPDLPPDRAFASEQRLRSVEFEWRLQRRTRKYLLYHRKTSAEPPRRPYRDGVQRPRQLQADTTRPFTVNDAVHKPAQVFVQNATATATAAESGQEFEPLEHPTSARATSQQPRGPATATNSGPECTVCLQNLPQTNFPRRKITLLVIMTPTYA